MKESVRKILDALENEKEGEVLASKFSDFVNSFSIPKKEFAEELLKNRSNLNKFFVLSFAFGEKLVEYFKREWYDERNKYASILMHRFFNVAEVEIKNFVKNTELEKEFVEKFTEKMIRTHRTLQQQFCGLLFYIMPKVLENIDVDKEIKKIIIKIHREYFNNNDVEFESLQRVPCI